jgi:Lon protease-like protein
LIKSVIASVAGSVRDSLKKNQLPLVELPIFPLGSVLFPGGSMSLKIFEQRYLDMAKTCLKTGAPFGIALIREGEEVGTPAAPESIGTLARVADWDMQNLGVLQLRVKGGERFRIVSRSVSKGGLISGQVAMLPTDSHVDCAEHAPCAAFLRKVFAQIDAGPPTEEARFDDASWVGFRITEILPFSTAIEQKMLELTDARMRLEILHRFLVDQRLID